MLFSKVAPKHVSIKHSWGLVSCQRLILPTFTYCKFYRDVNVLLRYRLPPPPPLNISTASSLAATHTAELVICLVFFSFFFCLPGLLSHTTECRNYLFIFFKEKAKWHKTLASGRLNVEVLLSSNWLTGGCLQPLDRHCSPDWIWTLAREANATDRKARVSKLMSAPWLETPVFASVPAVMRSVSTVCLIMHQPAASKKASLAG